MMVNAKMILPNDGQGLDLEQLKEDKGDAYTDYIADAQLLSLLCYAKKN